MFSQTTIWLSTVITSRVARCSVRWKATKIKAFMRETRPFILILLRKQNNMKSLSYLRPYRTVRDAENEDEFNAYIWKCKEVVLYDTGVT